MLFFVGLDDLPHAKHFERAMISVNRLKSRKSDFIVSDWIMDSGAFSELVRHGCYRGSVDDYADLIGRWSRCGNMLAAVSQDYMCEPFILEKTGLTITDHQRLTIERYDKLLQNKAIGNNYVMPVLQGYAPKDYAEHIKQYGGRISVGAWVGVGSVCKRNVNPDSIVDVLIAIKSERPDLRLHGFGIKTTALKYAIIRDALYSADSMAWSFSARKNGRNAHDYHEALDFVDRINNQKSVPYQYRF